MAAARVEPWLTRFLADLGELLNSERARTCFRKHVREWCADSNRSCQMFPPRPTRRLTPQERCVALAAIHDAYCAGDDPLGPDVWADSPKAIWDDRGHLAYGVLVHSHVPRLREKDLIGVRGWLLTVQGELSRRKRKTRKGDRMAGAAEKLYVELRERIRSEQARINGDERELPIKPSWRELAKLVNEKPPYISRLVKKYKNLRDLWDAFNSRELLLRMNFQ